MKIDLLFRVRSAVWSGLREIPRKLRKWEPK